MFLSYRNTSEMFYRDLLLSVLSTKFRADACLHGSLPALKMSPTKNAHLANYSEVSFFHSGHYKAHIFPAKLSSNKALRLYIEW